MVDKNITHLRLSDHAGEPGELISSQHFGGVYVGYRSIERFESIAEAAGLNLIRWPGGAAGEQADWYGLEFDDLVDSNSPKNGLTEVLAHAVEQGATLSIVIPTAEYSGDLDRARNDIREFVSRLMDGNLGKLPERLIFEIGNEYYAIPEFIAEPHLYGEVANVMVNEIHTFKTENPDLFDQVILETSVQIGKFEEDNSAIIDALTKSTIESIDHLVLHRFSWGLDDADSKVDHYNAAIEMWHKAGTTPDISILMSEWNVASWTRVEARDTFIDLQIAQFGVEYSPQDIDLEARSNAGFEKFWQYGTIVSPSGETLDTKFGLSKRDYGLAQASALIEIFSAGLEVGVDIASLYGVDTPYAGSIAFGGTRFVTSDMLKMMSERLPGTKKLNLDVDNQRDEVMNVWGFAAADRVVFYFSVDEIETAGGDFSTRIDLSELGYEVENASIRTLKSVLGETWMLDYQVPDNSEVDETPEGRLYEQGTMSIIEPVLSDGSLELTFEVPFQIIEVTIPLNHGEGGSVSSGSYVGHLEIDNFIFESMDSDVVTGTEENDLLNGSGNSNYYIGGSGEDVFVLDASSQVQNTILDYSGAIVDFELGEVAGDIVILQSVTQAHPEISGTDVEISGSIITGAASGNLMISYLNHKLDQVNWIVNPELNSDILSEHSVTKIYDLNDNESFSEIEVELDSAGNFSRFLVLNDDKTKQVISFDRTNNKDWFRHEETLSATDQVLGVSFHGHGGDIVTTVYDPNLVHTWESLMQRFDGKGEMVERLLVYDLGHSHRTIKDTVSDKIWETIREYRNTADRLYDKRVLYDNGYELRTVLDTAENNNWSSIQEFRDVNGYLFDKRFNYDDMTSQRIVLDVDDERKWDSIFELRSADGSLYDKRTNFDDGSRLRLIFDVDGQEWKTIREETTSSGNIHEKITTLHNGNSTRLIIDTESIHDWSQILENRNPEGELLKKSTSYGDGKLQILLFDTEGVNDWDVHSRIYDSDGVVISEQFD